MTLLSRIRAGRPGAPRPVGCGPSEDAAERWQRYWSGAFYLLLGAATIATVADAGTGWERRAGFVLVASVLVGWYRVFISSGRAWTDGPRTAALSYLGLVAAFVALVLLHPAAMFLTAALYWQLYSLVPVRWSIPGSAALTVLIWFLSAWRDGQVPRPTPGQLLIFAVMIAVSGLLAAYIDAIVRQSRERQRLLDELAATRRELAAAERQAGVEQERQRLAGEIHDTLAQGFASIVVHLQAAETAVPGTETAAGRHLDAARRAAREGLAESRRLVWALRPEALTRSSLPDAVRRTASRWRSSNGATATATVVGTARQLAPEAEVALLRATQEALANIAKHAGATKATVTLSYLDDAVALDVHDDGVGFDPDARRRGRTAEDASGFGLIGMEERVEALGGVVTIESEPGGGTTLAVNLPTPPLPEAAAIGEAEERPVVGDQAPDARLVPEAVGR
jgi:signal transduction histidine kinase